MPLLGPLLEDFATGLVATRLSPNSGRNRIRKVPGFLTVLGRHCDFQANRLTRHQWLAVGPPGARVGMTLLCLVRSLADYLGERESLAVLVPTPSARLRETYQKHSLEVRGLASSTVRTHIRQARELLAFLEFDDRPAAPRELDAPRLEGFVKAISPCFSRRVLQDAVLAVRVFLRFVDIRGESAPGLDRGLYLLRLNLRKAPLQNRRDALPSAPAPCFCSRSLRTSRAMGGGVVLSDGLGDVGARPYRQTTSPAQRVGPLAMIPRSE